MPVNNKLSRQNLKEARLYAKGLAKHLKVKNFGYSPSLAKEWAGLTIEQKLEALNIQQGVKYLGRNSEQVR